MKNLILRVAAVSLVMAGYAGVASSHGLMEDPPSRNWFCGAITKPDEVVYGTPEYPECESAFENDFNGGYQFMSVLTHERGRAAVSPLPDNVCGFGSETWNGGATPWDAAIDWPTTPMRPGRQEFKWNIQWGPHFSDTEEFRYWITKPGFQFEVGKPLTWDDFEPTEFCALQYDDNNPNANPDVIPVKASEQFRTFCEVPQRSGRHVIYGEWGRNIWTLERFHGCVDVAFDGGTTPPPPPSTTVNAVLDAQPADDPAIGDGTIALDASASTGQGLTYAWNVDAADTSLYSFDDASQAVTTLRLANPAAAQQVTVTLMVSSATGTDSTNFTFLHEPEVISDWIDLGPLVKAPTTLRSGDLVSLRTVLSNGQDVHYPVTPLTIDDSNRAADAWPLALAQAIDAIAGADVAIGILDANDQVDAAADATANRIYALAGSEVVSAFLEVISDKCNVIVRGGANPWWVGLDVGTDLNTITLDFTGTGLDLSDNLRLDQGVFQAQITGQQLTLSVPGWVSLGTPGYIGFNANNNPALTTFSPPRCL